jgi:Rnl2 family RNA ligase
MEPMHALCTLRNIYKNGETTNQDGYGFVNFINEHGWGGLKQYPNYVFYGEFHGQGIQKGVKYCDGRDLRVFDVKHPHGHFSDWETVERICEIVGFRTVPVVFKGSITIEQLNEFVDVSSEVAKFNNVEVDCENIAEGVVIKPLEEKRDRRGNRIIAKLKSNKWAELARAPKTKRPDSNRAAIQAAAREFAEAVVTEGRVATIVDHITRDGNVELNIRRTGDFLRAFIHDVMDEFPEVYSALDRKEQNVYNKIVNGYASKLWQDYLAKSA